jgi:hypothetical protein
MIDMKWTANPKRVQVTIRDTVTGPAQGVAPTPPHAPAAPPAAARPTMCSSVTKTGQPCSERAVIGADGQPYKPVRCRRHGRGHRPAYHAARLWPRELGAAPWITEIEQTDLDTIRLDVPSADARDALGLARGDRAATFRFEAAHGTGVATALMRARM